jgi:hypothetical protein
VENDIIIQKGISMKTITLSLFILLLITGCSPHMGVGIGGVTSIGNNGVGASEIHVDETGGVHGSVGVGTDIRL